MTFGPATAPPVAPPPSRRPPLITNPYVGILGVLIGAGIETLNSRLLSVGLPDLRGAMGFGYDQGSWIPTALGMATMFSGVFVVFLNSLAGPRRILLPAAATFAIVSLLLPFAPNYWVMLGLVTIAGVSSGTFYTLTMTVVLTALPKRLIILGIAGYAAEVIFVVYTATALEGWYIQHLSWRWIFWTAAFVTPLMVICVFYGIPHRARPDHRPSWRGFVYFSVGLGLLVGALDQGERLDWLNSGVIVAMLAAGLLLIGAALKRASQPNPTLNLSFLNQRNIIILSAAVFVFKFAQFAELMLVPAFLGNIQGYRPLQTGQALLWVALPGFAAVGLVAALMIHTNSRLILTIGLTVAAVACWFCAQMDASWAANNFVTMELFMAVGFAGTFAGLVGSIVFGGPRVRGVAQACQRGHIRWLPALHPYLRRCGGCSRHDPLHLGAGAVSFQPAGTSCRNRELAYGRPTADARRRTAAGVHRATASTISRCHHSGRASAGASLHDGDSGWIHPDRMDGGRLSIADAAPEAWQVHVHRSEENAMSRRTSSLGF